MKNDDFIGSQGEFAELCWEKNGGREMRKMIRLFNATPGERLGWIVGLRRHLSALKVNPGGQRCHVLLRGAICWRSFHEEQRMDIDLLNANPGGQICHVLLRGATCRRSFH